MEEGFIKSGETIKGEETFVSSCAAFVGRASGSMRKDEERERGN
jgi:hypothetical protein